jgi:Cupin domain
MLTGTGMHHIHPLADEEFLVRRGQLSLSIDSVRHQIGPGERLVVTRGTPHYFLNMSLGTLNHPEWYDQRGEPPLLLRALALHAYADHGYAAANPVWLQKTLFAVLTPVALLRGYRLSVPPR